MRSDAALKVRSTAAKTMWWLIVLGFMMFFAVPVLWLLLAPTKTDGALVNELWFKFGSLEQLSQTWSNLVAFQDGVIFTWLGNSVLYAFSGMALAVITAVPAGYALAVFKFPGRKALLMLTLVVMVMPTAVLVLPLYLEMEFLGLAGTPLSVILPFGMFPFGVYLVFIYHSTNMPRSILEAAELDGASRFGIFTKIALPLGKPVAALVSFFAFTGAWNNYFLPFVMLPQTKTYPVTVGLNNLLTSTPAFNPTVGASGLDIYRPELALATALAIVPVLVVFLFNQKALVSGMMAGASKE